MNNRLIIDRGVYNGFKISMFCISTLLILQGYFIYHLRKDNVNLVEKYNVCINNNLELTDIIHDNEYINTNDQEEVSMFDKWMNIYVRCFLPKYYIDKCFP